MESPQQKSKMRSPNYPGHSLDVAIDRVKVIYDSQRQYPSTRETFARLLGYKGLSGSSVKILSSLSKYGLLEGSGDSLRVSDIGQDLALHRPGDPEYAQAVREAAFRPGFFRELHDQYPQGLPSDHALRAQLKKRGFTDSAISDAVGAYTETMALVSKLTTDFENEQDENNSANIGDFEEQNRSRALGTRQRGSQRMLAEDDLKTVVLPLQGASWAELRGPFPITVEAWSMMMSVLEAMKPALTGGPRFPDGALVDAMDGMDGQNGSTSR